MDIRIAYSPTNEPLGTFDLVLAGADLDTGHTLETAVLMSLFTNRRAESDDRLPDTFTDRQGWWGDDFPVRDGDRIGSRLWLLSAEKQTNQTRLRYLEYAAEALQWLIDDQVASQIRIEAEYVRLGVLGMRIEILRGDGSLSRFQYLWDHLAAQPLPGDESLEFGSSAVYLVTEDGKRLLTEQGQKIIV